MIDGMVFVIMGVCVLLISLGKAWVSKNPEATTPWLKKWGIVLRICGPIVAQQAGLQPSEYAIQVCVGP